MNDYPACNDLSYEEVVVQYHSHHDCDLKKCSLLYDEPTGYFDKVGKKLKEEHDISLEKLSIMKRKPASSVLILPNQRPFKHYNIYYCHIVASKFYARKLVQWLSSRVLDSRPRGRGFEPHRRHCVVVLEQDTFILA